MSVRVYRDLRAPLPVGGGGEAVELPAYPGLKVTVLNQVDREDPLNQATVACLKVGDRFALRADAENGEHPAVAAAVRELLVAVIEHHAEIRDALADVNGA